MRELIFANRHFRGSKKEFIFANLAKIREIRKIFFPRKFLPVRHDVIIKQKSRLHIKLGKVVDSIEIHILCENQEILQKLAVAKICKIMKKIRH